MTGFAAALSGVAQPQPNRPAPAVDGSLKPPVPKPFCPPNGLAKLGWLRRLKNSARNCTFSRSPSFQPLATEKSQFLKPESRNRLRPMVPKLPRAGGIITELPLAKQPNSARDCCIKGVVASAAHAGLVAPEEYGIPTGPDLKSLGLPKKSQRSIPVAAPVDSPVPLTSVDESVGPQGCAPAMVTIEFNSQPSSSWATDFLPGMAYVVDTVRRFRISKSLLAYSR